jgi:hypothetical protein
MIASVSRPDRRHWRVRVPAALVLMLLLLVQPVLAQSSDLESRVKAAFLFNFTKFVDWPAAAFDTPTSPLTICVLGADPFGNLLDDALQGRTVGGRPLTTRRIAEVEPGCHVLFVSTSERKRMRTSPVLTIGDADGEDGENGLGMMIELFTDGDRVRFNFHPKTVERAGLRASARLIALAANQQHGAAHR